MPEPPWLTCFDTEEDRLYFELPSDVRAPHITSKAELGYPTEEAHLSSFLSRISGPQCERTSKLWSVPFDPASVSSSFNFIMTNRSNTLITEEQALIYWFISIQPLLVNKTPIFLTSSTWWRDSPLTWRENSTLFRLTPVLELPTHLRLHQQ